MLSRTALEDLYRRYNRQAFVHPDPVELLYPYADLCDREVVALVAACLAYGRVGQILASARSVLDRLGSGPAAVLRRVSPRSLAGMFSRFRHRFTTGTDLTALLAGVGRALDRHGSLNACFLAGLDPADPTVVPALSSFVAEVAGRGSHLLPTPADGSACKRLNLFLRWRVRSDEVDPGGWEGVSPSQLVVPLDTHMARVARRLRLTQRKSVNMAMALQVTDAFRAVRPDDPVRYDFALTRLGIRSDIEEVGQIRTLGSGPRPSTGRGGAG